MLLKQSDLDFVLAQVLFGANPPPGTDPFTTQGIRNVDGTNNNLLHIASFVDQYGDTVKTDSFAVSNQPFIHMTAASFHYAQTPGNPGAMVTDSSPRTISNLIADMNALTNPNLPPPEDPILGNPGDPPIFLLPFNSLFTIFGQFVDHGLDFINKGGSGVIQIPVLPTDPLFSQIPEGSPASMFLSRASVGAGGVNINSTAPLVDQQQTYGSDQSTRFFLMEYNDLGQATGRLVTGADGGMATWADIKANAAKRGIILTDADVANLPAIGAPLAYDGQTANFKVGTILTGTTSGATARIVGDADGGATGTLTLQNIVGTFADNEIITDNTLAYHTQNTDFTVGTVVTGATSGATGVIVADADGGAAGTLTLQNVTGTFANNEMLNAQLAYTGQTVNFVVGTTLTGATSAATAVIVSDADAGATGTLTLRNITGVFQNGETISDGTGTAVASGGVVASALANGTMGSALANGTILPNTYSRGAGVGQAFLADIAHSANPAGKTADTDNALGLLNAGGAAANPATTYDNELLNAHFVSGDGRTNENVVLSAIHEVFHNEHNRLLLQIEDMIAQRDQIQPGFAAQWTGEMKFEAARLGNEMQYQHIVFEFFARRMSPNITAFAEYQVEINPNILTEFSQAVFRLGHSMLTDTVASVSADGVTDPNAIVDMTLKEAFLNPTAFSTLGAANLAEGMSRQMGNQIDEFVVDSVRNQLLGLPLDLAAINIARGRDVGIAKLNQVRTDLFAQTGEDSLAPYTSWADFGGHMLHPTSLVNYIAAYAQRADFVTARNNGDLAGARALAQAEIDLNGAFLNGGDLGFNDIDLWIGGLAEQKVTGGMLGSTFDFIFATQFLALQNGDRLYYLNRLGGTNFLHEIESQGFGDLLQRATGATHTNGDIFGVADQYIEMSSLTGPAQTNFTKTSAEAALNVHEVVGGTNLANNMNGGNGNDTLWGEGGNDILSGGLANDFLFGGDGIDILSGGDDDDFLRGDAGDDILNGGLGLDALIGGTGNDTMNGNNGDDELFAGLGNDILNGGNGADLLEGLDGNDRMDGGNDADTLDGGLGNDVMFGRAGADSLAGGEGDDYLIGGTGGDLMDGGLAGYDIASYETSFNGLVIDMAGGNPNSLGEARGDTFLNIEEVRGTNFADQMLGDLAANVLTGGGGNDSLDGLEGSDTLIGGLGDDTLIDTGAAGADVAVFSGARAGYTITAFDVTDINLGDGNDGVDAIGGIEFLRFSDQIVHFDTGATVPLISLSNTAPLQLGFPASPVFGNVANTITVNDNTIIPAGGVNVAAIQIADPDGIIAGTRTFALAGADAASFAFAPGNGSLMFIGGGAGSRTNYEAKPVYHVTVNVADANGGSSINYTLNVTDVNDNRPTITSATHVNFQENTPTNVVVYRIAGVDQDSIGPAALTFSLTGTDAGDFIMSNGEIRFVTSPDFELPSDANQDGVYNIVVGVSDGVGPTTTQAVTINLTDAADGGNAPPTFTTTPPASVPENSTGVFYDANASDPNGDPLTYELGGTDSGDFTLNPTTGELSFNFPPDFEAATDSNNDNVYNVSISVDDDGPGGPHAPVVQTFNVTVTDVQEGAAAPVFTTTPANPILAPENTATTTVIYDAEATDANVGDTVTYSIDPASPDAGDFTIDPTNGQLRFLVMPNFEAAADAGANNVYNITILASDGTLSTPQAVNVSVTNVNEAPTFTTNPANPISVAENSTGTLYDANATDPESGNVTSFTLSGVDAGLFTLNATTGVLTFTTPPNFEGPGDNNYTVQITANAAGGPSSAPQTVNVVVTNVNGVTITGTAGNDTVNQTQTVAGQQLPTVEPDTINGNAGNDGLSGLAGGDTINGGDGNDSLFGNSGNDILNGDNGIDTLNGGTGNDAMNGGAGNDTFVFATGFGNDTIAGFDADAAGGQDLLNIAGTGITAATFAASVIITPGANTVVTIGANSITLLAVNGIAPNDITQADFILA